MAEGVNKVILVGQLGKDPETKTMQDGKMNCKFSLATSETYGGNKKTEWHNITVWGKTAEIVSQYCKKGKQIYLEGKIQYRSYEKDGQTKYITEINARKITFLGGGQKQEKRETYAKPDDGWGNDDLPFGS